MEAVEEKRRWDYLDCMGTPLALLLMVLFLAQARRLLSDHESDMQRQFDTLGRAIHSLAETLNLTSPLVGAGETLC